MRAFTSTLSMMASGSTMSATAPVAREAIRERMFSRWPSPPPLLDYDAAST